MGVKEELAKYKPEKDTLLTIGVFDGVHLGHKHLISELKERARKQNLMSGVVTFRRHPQDVLSPKTRLPYLTDLEQRVNLLKNEGVEVVVTLSFTPELAKLGVREFVSLLKEYLRMRGLVVGPDFALGRNRGGDVNTLRTLGKEINFSVAVVSLVMINGGVVSSTAIRKALADGNMKKVHNLIGRLFSLHGRVVSGTGRGRELGFPTANLGVSPGQALPADGVYATRAYISDKTYQSVTSIGTRPTFDGKERVVEVYILDYNGNLYGQELKIDVVERLRGEERFKTVDELKKKMAEDVKQGRAVLNSKKQGTSYG
jgi:riboflavin kinase/FMN adenylyltransferase